MIIGRAQLTQTIFLYMYTHQQGAVVTVSLGTKKTLFIPSRVVAILVSLFVELHSITIKLCLDVERLMFHQTYNLGKAHVQ